MSSNVLRRLTDKKGKQLSKFLGIDSAPSTQVIATMQSRINNPLFKLSIEDYEAMCENKMITKMMSLVSDVYSQNIKPKVWPETARLAQQHIAAGREVWLITAAPQEMGEEIARALGLTGALGTRLEHIDGILTGNLVGKPLHGKEKPKAIRKLAKERGFN